MLKNWEADIKTSIIKIDGYIASKELRSPLRLDCQLREAALARITPASTRIMELLKLESASRDHLVPPSDSEHGQLELRAMSSWVLSSSKDGDSTISLCSLFLCLNSLAVKNFLLKWDCLYFYLFPLSLVLSLGTTEKSLVLSSLLSSQTAPSMSLCMGLFLPGTEGLRTQHSSL